jgi:hypothetical protein
MVKRYTRKLKRGGATYLEQQDRALCGKHALNHILQEAKFVWDQTDKNKNNLYIPRLPAGTDAIAHAKKQGTQVNLVMACREYENDDLNMRLAKLYPGLLDSLIRRLQEDVEPESSDIKIPPVGSSERKQEKYKGKTDAEIRKIIEDGRGEAFALSQKRQAEERAKYKKYIKTDATGKPTDIDREALDVVYKKEWSADEKKTIETEGAVCQPGGNIIPEIFTKWINIMGYKGLTTAFTDIDESGVVAGALKTDEGKFIYNHDTKQYLKEMLKILPSQIAKQEFLGVMLGRLTDREGHYTAVVMYDELECEPKRRVEADPKKKLYSYIDSMFVTEKEGVCKIDKGTPQCYTLDGLLKKIKEYGPTCMIFIYGYDEDDKGPLNPYKSVAYNRMKAAAAPAAAAPAGAPALKNKENSNEESGSGSGSTSEASGSEDESEASGSEDESEEETPNNIKAALKASEVTAAAEAKAREEKETKALKNVTPAPVKKVDSV